MRISLATSMSSNGVEMITRKGAVFGTISAVRYDLVRAQYNEIYIDILNFAQISLKFGH